MDRVLWYEMSDINCIIEQLPNGPERTVRIDRLRSHMTSSTGDRPPPAEAADDDIGDSMDWSQQAGDWS